MNILYNIHNIDTFVVCLQLDCRSSSNCRLIFSLAKFIYIYILFTAVSSTIHKFVKRSSPFTINSYYSSLLYFIEFSTVTGILMEDEKLIVTIHIISPQHILYVDCKQTLKIILFKCNKIENETNCILC